MTHRKCYVKCLLVFLLIPALKKMGEMSIQTSFKSILAEPLIGKCGSIYGNLNCLYVLTPQLYYQEIMIGTEDKIYKSVPARLITSAFLYNSKVENNLSVHPLGINYINY